jgi:hypothetical protein
MKTACFIYSDNKKYDKMQECAMRSFKKFHPEIPIFYSSSSNKNFQQNEGIPPGYKKLIFSYLIAEQQNIEKIIILGADTITCDRLDEFLSDDSTDILTTLDYPYQLRMSFVSTNQINTKNINSISNLILSSSDQDHVNADVVCFNNSKALKETINCLQWMSNEYYEQGALNFICNVQNKYTSKIVDGDYENSNVVYNARSKGNTCERNPKDKPWFKYTNLFKVENKKLFTGTHENCSKSKQIKIWHYIEGFSGYSDQKIEESINTWINEGFNQETKDFFTNECDCGDFFKQKFII